MNSQTTNFFLLFIFICVAGFSAKAQTGVIRGLISDANTKAPVVGASVKFRGANQGVATNTDGAFEFIKIEPGTYQLQVTYLGYQELQVQDIVIGADQVVNLKLELQPAGENIEEVVIRAARQSNTSHAVISEVKTARQIVSGISQQQIRLSQDRDAAQVMSRIPGLTIVENRFVIVRGVPERYNQVMLNNAIAPSTEVDRRTFSFDLVPSSVLDRMMIYKSGSPENPGDFAGGLIKVYTSNAANQNFTSFSIGSNIRTNTTFNPYIYSRTSATDFLGFDGGERKLPANFPKENFLGMPNNDPRRTEAPKLLNNDLSYTETTAMPDFNFGAALGRSWRVGGIKQLNMLTSLSYSQSQSFFQRDFARYLIQNPADYGQPATLRSNYVDKRYERDNRVGILSNWALVISPFHKLEFKNLFNQLGENTTILREGEDFNQQTGLNRQHYMYQYRSRSIYSGQLEGTHRFKAGLSSVNWVLGLNRLSENQPDLRRFRTVQVDAGSDEYRMLLPSSSNLFDTGRYFGELAEFGINNGLNFERVLSGSGDDAVLLRAGYLVDYRDRNFSSRYFSYRLSGSVSADEQSRLERLPLDQIFADENFGPNGFSAEEGTTGIDSYDGSNLLSAGYLGVVWPMDNFQVSGGVRVEYNILKLNSVETSGVPVQVNNKVLSPLGFLNLDYTVSDFHKVRLSYGRTVNRPEFREIAPFLFYDYEFDLNRYGNPNLVTATIDNFDARYEIYPRAGETISIGGFYKRINNPIETTIIPQAESPSFGFTNATGGAYNYGVELEVRKSFKDMTASSFLDKMSVNLNASYIKSEVDYGDEAIGQDRTRPLQGQSPYIVNAVLSYDNPNSGWQVSGAYNILGPRIFAIGNLQFPAIYELSRHALDLTLTKSFRNNISLKLGAQDLLNAPYQFYQDTDRNEKIDSRRDDVVFNYRRGTLFSTAITYTIK